MRVILPPEQKQPLFQHRPMTATKPLSNCIRIYQGSDGGESDWYRPWLVRSYGGQGSSPYLDMDEHVQHLTQIAKFTLKVRYVHTYAPYYVS